VERSGQIQVKFGEENFQDMLGNGIVSYIRNYSPFSSSSVPREDNMKYELKVANFILVIFS
jgi:hypothetical protein